jgi:SAM-dependent methyltransferase
MSDLKKNHWDESYKRGENYIFYPQTEVVKFINRFIKKRTDINTFKDILKSDQKLKALDFGSGIGRNVILCEEFGIEGYGIDISENAVKKAKEFFGYFYDAKKIGNLKNRFSVINDEKIPFVDNFFDFSLSDCVLDSMSFEHAKKIAKELDRVTKKYLFISLISGSIIKKDYSGEVIVKTEHENGTVQSYYSLPKIKKLIEGTNWKIKWMNLITEENITAKSKNARFYVVLEK